MIQISLAWAITAAIQQTFALLPGSLAIDAGDDASCEATDQRGESRVGICDIGATESQGFAMILSEWQPSEANLEADFAQPLQVSLIASDTNLILSNQMITFTAPSSGASLTLMSRICTTDR